MKCVLTILALCFCLAGCGEKKAPNSQAKAEATPKTEPKAEVKKLWLRGNPDLTKTQIAELQKVLPKCKIIHNAKK